MKIVASNSITVSNVNDGTITHIAYANSADGTDGFYIGGGRNLLNNTDKDISDRQNWHLIHHFDHVETIYKYKFFHLYQFQHQIEILGK